MAWKRTSVACLEVLLWLKKTLADRSVINYNDSITFNYIHSLLMIFICGCGKRVRMSLT